MNHAVNDLHGKDTDWRGGGWTESLARFQIEPRAVQRAGNPAAPYPPARQWLIKVRAAIFNRKNPAFIMAEQDIDFAKTHGAALAIGKV